ncbi:M20 metallopeptidase family protein [Bacillus weihaiensis]|uniref:Amidohydrolase n=1 Tax=Bacillus weihaiensis TaxID=1547283 RepID=A0A1L3MRR1_9BACI|nr:amidohydrolase [Bacillus weihaiensis]APH05032.1 amidohydrolase [Bacillus weihaiensis]
MEIKNLELIKTLRHELHQHPELSNEEEWTKQHVMNFLASQTKLTLVDKGKWFYAIYHAGENRKNIAFRADFDALPIDETINLPYASQFPGVSHKCGHDGHTASLCGLALEVDQKGAKENVYFLFQHAEEIGEGAAECVTMLDEHGIDEIYAYHNMSDMEENAVYIIDGTAHFASKGMIITLEGEPAHASQPENGKNPAYAFAQIINSIGTFSAPENNKGDVVCTVIHVNIGEKAFGIAASKGELLLTLRALYENELQILQQNIKQLAERLAKAYGLKLMISYNDMFPETVNHKESSDKIRTVCMKKKIPLVEMKNAFKASEDFGHYVKKTKGAIFYIGNGIEYPQIHTKEYDFNDHILETSVEMFKGLLE